MGQGKSRGFSLIELLVVIGIIGVLIGILVPTISSVRRSAKIANTQAQIAAISNACERYYQDFAAYPGIFSNDSVIGGAPATIPAGVSMSENLVLSLMGGIYNNAGPITFDAARVGKGAVSLSTLNPKQYPVYLDLPAADLSSGAGNVNANTDVPEIVDRFDVPRPVLYLRARVGASGVVGDNGVPLAGQYDLKQITPYIQTAAPKDGLEIVGANLTLPVGMTELEALLYFRNPAMGGVDNASSTPKQKDSYILISAGADRLYGTIDDITNFGDILP